MKKGCAYCTDNHYDNRTQTNLIQQVFSDGSILTTKIVEGTLHSWLNLNQKTSVGTKKYDYSKCCEINYCPICGVKLDKDNVLKED